MTVSRRSLARVAIGLAAAAAFYFVLWESEESRVRATVERLAAALHRGSSRSDGEWRQGLHRTFEESVTPEARLTVPELGVVEGRARLLELALESGGIVEVELDPSSVHVEEHRARVRARVTLTQHLPGFERSEVRTASIDLVPQGDGFQVDRIELGEPQRDQPEARP